MGEKLESLGFVAKEGNLTTSRTLAQGPPGVGNPDFNRYIR